MATGWENVREREEYLRRGTLDMGDIEFVRLWKFLNSCFK